MSKLNVRFIFDKEKKKVVFAEAGSDFVDILFSFLTLPLGSIVPLFNKQSGLGSLDNLYKSAEQLDTKYMHTEACKEMLLNPRSAAAILCEDLKIENIHDPHPRNFYICLEDDCLVRSTCYYTYTKNCVCDHCGKQMNEFWNWVKETSEGGVFVTQGIDFIITNDLRVMPISFMNGILLLTKLQIKDASILEERVMEVSKEEVLNFLQRSLVSKNALTEVFFPDAQANVDCSLLIKEEKIVDEEEQGIKIKLLLNQRNNKVLYAEVGEDFVIHLLSFLTLPLGSVFRFLPANMSSGCIINLYKSVGIIDLNYFKSEVCRDMLLAPKLPTFYGFKNQILNIEEITSKKWTTSKGCAKCYSDNGYNCSEFAPCKHGIKQTELIEQNPKSTKGVVDSDEGFMISSRRFMVDDSLNISPLSFISVLSNENNLPIYDLAYKEVYMDTDKAILLLGTTLISKTVLTDVFIPKQVQQKKRK